MKTYTVRLLIRAFIMAMMWVSVMTGCNKVSHNGDLDGMWQVMTVLDSSGEELATNGMRCYYNFYLHTCQLSTADGRVPKMVGNMSVSDGVIYMDFPYVGLGEVDELWMTRLWWWGIPETGKVSFEYSISNKNTLRLKRDDVEVICRRF